MARSIQNQIDHIDLEAPRLRQYDQERYQAAMAQRQRLVLEQSELSRLEIETMNRAAMKFQARQTIQIFPTGEESFRCRNCQRLSRTLYCYACRREGQDWRC